MRLTRLTCCGAFTGVFYLLLQMYREGEDEATGEPTSDKEGAAVDKVRAFSLRPQSEQQVLEPLRPYSCSMLCACRGEREVFSREQ